MNGQTNGASSAKLDPSQDFDVLIIGAGQSGMYSLHRMKQIGLKARVLEAGSGEGGTWFWNRYPGARFDSESYSYIFSFDQSLLDEWDWSEHFAAQKETLAYCQYFAKKFGLHQDMQFNTRVSSAHWQENSNSWLVTDEMGKTYTSRFLITAMGILNQPTLPNIPGVNDFKGAAFHTSRWPDDASALKGNRVAIIGTGATAIQIIQEIKRTVGSLTVFQRTPNWTAPLRNTSISKEEMAEIRRKYPQIFQDCLDSYACFIHKSDSRSVFDVNEQERLKHWEHLYSQAGFSKWLSNFRDIGTDRQANELFSKFVANKIRQRVHDPEVAEKLIPKSHGFGTRRVPLEGGYYEAFNQPNVRLVDINENPIERIHEQGIKTQDEDFEFDVIIYATGFDAVTGSFSAVDFRGIGGHTLKGEWAKGLQTFLGLTVRSFPNMFMIMGPHQMFGNIPRSIEYAVGWVADLIQYCANNGIARVEATEEGVKWWTDHVHQCAIGLLANEVDSWMTGVNKNVAGKQKRSIARYNGPASGYRRRCEDIKSQNYAAFKLVKN
ncbi:FAD/NAD(P)-binding domain-containing protein [Corynespora cassiicola Philippines]|uniref:FAD/NAD(P)-binding domain-containing protein n=1 Tax=Corynespora cassiicola Philippines TaxID=1448308 RepID=A0A2T2NPT5_CORCC|nr:FAD/NAD(P)-binding domain-containing protein [Corynespora cassiicola Philippines]